MRTSTRTGARAATSSATASVLPGSTKPERDIPNFSGIMPPRHRMSSSGMACNCCRSCLGGSAVLHMNACLRIKHGRPCRLPPVRVKSSVARLHPPVWPFLLRHLRRRHTRSLAQVLRVRQARADRQASLPCGVLQRGDGAPPRRRVRPGPRRWRAALPRVRVHLAWSAPEARLARQAAAHRSHRPGDGRAGSSAHLLGQRATRHAAALAAAADRRVARLRAAGARRTGGGGASPPRTPPHHRAVAAELLRHRGTFLH